MNDKFTLRDFFVYFLSGIVVLLFICANFYDQVKKTYGYIEVLKDFSSVVIFFSIPISYFIGQIIHGIDTLIFYFASFSRKLKIANKNWYNPKWILFYGLNANRIAGRLYIKEIDNELFWENCAKLQVKNQFTACEYWYIMNDLFKGLSLASFIFLLISIIQCNWKLGIIYFFLFIFFWLRALYFAKNFISVVNRTIKFI